MIGTVLLLLLLLLLVGVGRVLLCVNYAERSEVGDVVLMIGWYMYQVSLLSCHLSERSEVS